MPATRVTIPDWKLTPATRSTKIGTLNGVSGVKVTQPYFAADITLQPMWHDDKREWDAFFASLDGAFGSFILPAAHRRWPLAHPGGLVGYNGQASIASWATDGDVNLSGLASSGFIISKGDYIQITSGTTRTVVIACDTVTGGSTRKLTLRGLYDQTAFPAGSTVNFYNPAALFRLSDFNLDIRPGPTPVTFSANQCPYP
jgi:hypothetical protein